MKMGVRGLTTFIANRSDAYLRNYKLHDTYLVIDGHSLAANLYQSIRTRNDSFGGDYDKFAKTVCSFFDALLQCNITPIVVLDGTYEKKKTLTIFKRLKDNIKSFENVNTVNQTYKRIFPLLFREVFVDVIITLGIKIVRCAFEADHELACLAKSLNCPLLSLDSDFYIYDVLYVPYVTLEMVPRSSENGFFLRCQLYEMEHFLKAYGGLNKSVMPLLAVLLGNDYTDHHVFKDIDGLFNRNISGLIQWLRNETYDTAVVKILNRLPKDKRQKAVESINMVVEGYVCKKSELLKDLDINTVTDTDTKNDALGKATEDTEEEDNIDWIPIWFRTNYRNCLYPSAFTDVLVRNIYFCIPQLENYSNICSHTICVKIVAAFNKILRPDSTDPCKYVVRHQASISKNDVIPACNLSLPTLHTLNDLPEDQAHTYLFQILEIDIGLMDAFSNLPKHWELYVLSMIYWIKNATPNVAYSHVYSIVLCMLTMNKIAPCTDHYVHMAKLLAKYKHKLKVGDLPSNSSCPTLNSVSQDDSVRCYKHLAKYFDMDEKMRRSAQSYNISILDCFAQFQSSLQHIKYLNSLLNKPLSKCIVSEFYNGTFLYNMCTTLEKCTNIDACIDTLLGPFPTVLNCFKTIMNMFVTVMSCNVVSVVVRKQLRKRKCSTNLSENVDDADTPAEDLPDPVLNSA